jgi:hypothetical protein
MMATTAPCPACARDVPPDAEFCPWCGAPLTARTAAPAPIAAPERLPAPRARTTPATAVFLELLPLLAPVAAAILGGVLTAFSAVPGLDGLSGATGLLFILTLFSGIGWIAAGRPGVGCTIMAVRLIGMIVLLAIAIGSVIDCWDDDACGVSAGAAVVAAVLGTALLVIAPIVSAAALWAWLRGADADAAG